MSEQYVELRKSAARGTDSVAADIMRHLYARQLLGKAVIVADRPLDISGPARKQWLKLSRALQKQRSSTLNADKILKYTHVITRMQHMNFSVKSPLDQPDSDAYFLSPDDLHTMPMHCWSVYVLCPIERGVAEDMLRQLPSGALIVDYTQSALWHRLGLKPKSMLEDRVVKEWRQVAHFLESQHIDSVTLTSKATQDAELMDGALDTLLGVNYKFLQVANEFQRALELARPLRISKELRASYDAFVLLAHRVQSLSPGALSQQFLDSYNEDDTFFLHDPTKHLHASPIESLAEVFARHTAAGRHNLARALQLVAS